jgi:hypothetical protein
VFREFVGQRFEMRPNLAACLAVIDPKSQKFPVSSLFIRETGLPDGRPRHPAQLAKLMLLIWPKTAKHSSHQTAHCARPFTLPPLLRMCWMRRIFCG